MATKDIAAKTFNICKQRDDFAYDKSSISFVKNHAINLAANRTTNFANKIFNEDVLITLKRMPDNSVDMIYGDPDYNVGINYAGAKYTQQWDEYIAWYIELAKESMRVLKPEGNLFMMNYPKQNAHLRVRYLDDNAYSVFDYVWIYNTNVGHSPSKFTTAHRSILHATKSKHNAFYKDQVAVPYRNPTDKRIIHNIEKGSKGCMPYSWWYFDLVKNVSKDKTFHSCQIPLNLVQMLIEASTKEDDLVHILFGGSGSELVLCNKLKRNFISSELHKAYYEMIVDRLNNNGEIKDEYKLPISRADKSGKKLKSDFRFFA
ncbi:methyltransferase [Campylobacterota bacterium]|nr:methyltransferase [Campylobacterota bacterium]